MPNVAELIKEHVTLAVDCVDRLDLKASVPRLQSAGGVVTFLEHRGKSLPSPALLGKITEACKRDLRARAEQDGIPWIEFKQGERKDDVVQPYRDRLTASGGRAGVVLVGVAQEKASAWRATKQGSGRAVRFTYARTTVYVNHSYVSFLDREWRPGVLKVCGYAPYTMQRCLNGHEWAKRQLTQRGIAFAALDNGFLSCADPALLQAIGATLSAADIEACFTRWLGRRPLPLTATDQAAGFAYRRSILPLALSRTQVFDDPLRGRECFEEVIRENLDVGRPDRVQLLFARKITRATPGRFTTRVITDGVAPSLPVEYQRCHVKHYWKIHTADYRYCDERCTDRAGHDRRSNAPAVRPAAALGGHRHGAAAPGAGLPCLGGTRRRAGRPHRRH